MTYQIEQRQQHAKRGRGMFAGPNTYIAVQCIPEGAEPLRYLQHNVAAKRGIRIMYMGEGYREHSGPRSMLGRALAAAEAFVQEVQS